MVDYTADLQRTARWGAYFAETWAVEAPDRIHTSVIGTDGTPDWHPAFARWLTMEERRERRPEESARTTRAMRKLRRESVREFEVLYRILILRHSLDDTTRWLNARAVAHDIPLPPGRDVHYRRKDTLAILIAGVAFALHHW